MPKLGQFDAAKCGLRDCRQILLQTLSEFEQKD